MARKKRIALVVAGLLIVGAGAAGADEAYAYTNIDYPGAPITFAFGLNERHTQIVGNYFDSSFERHAFLLSGGVFSTIDPPGGTDNSANNINN